jgi:AraC family transcriptional activator of pobA
MKTSLFPFYTIGHFINEPLNPTTFEITRFEEMEEPEIEDPHKHSFYEILWMSEGVSSHVIDYKEYPIEPNTLYFISPGQLHHFEEWQHIKGGSIMFTEDFFLFHHQNKEALFTLSFLDNFYTKPYLKPDTEQYHEIQHTIDLLFAEKSRADYSPTIAQALLHVVLGQIQRCVDAERRSQHGVALSKRSIILYKTFKNLLDAHFQEGLTAGEYADKLAITQHHLNHIVKSVTDKTTTEIIRDRSLLEAKRLLTFTDLPISEIAAGLRYFDSSYFAKQFKAVEGLSPREFRERISEKYRTI